MSEVGQALLVTKGTHNAVTCESQVGKINDLFVILLRIVVVLLLLLLLIMEEGTAATTCRCFGRFVIIRAASNGNGGRYWNIITMLL